MTGLESFPPDLYPIESTQIVDRKQPCSGCSLPDRAEQRFNTLRGITIGQIVRYQSLRFPDFEHFFNRQDWGPETVPQDRDKTRISFLNIELANPPTTLASFTSTYISD